MLCPSVCGLIKTIPVELSKAPCCSLPSFQGHIPQSLEDESAQRESTKSELGSDGPRSGKNVYLGCSRVTVLFAFSAGQGVLSGPNQAQTKNLGLDMLLKKALPWAGPDLWKHRPIVGDHRSCGVSAWGGP